MECHSPRTDGRSDLSALGKGGEKFEGPWGVSVSRNITSHPVAGLGGWSDVEIKRAITQGVGKGGRKLLPPMGFAWYARMTEPDLDAIVAYLRRCRFGVSALSAGRRGLPSGAARLASRSERSSPHTASRCRRPRSRNRARGPE